MSVHPSRHLPERPSLEQLRKQAKEHLDTLRAADPSVKLAAAQHALAREYGFESWPKLVHHVESMQPATRMLQPAELKSDEKLLWSPGRGTDVWALIQACISGDLDAVRALIAKDPSLARAALRLSQAALLRRAREPRRHRAISARARSQPAGSLGRRQIRSRSRAIAATREMEQTADADARHEVQRLVEGRTGRAGAAGARSEADARAARRRAGAPRARATSDPTSRSTGRR